MKIKSIQIFSLILSSLFISSIIPLGFSAMNPYDYELGFWVGGVRIWASYPNECYAGETITIDLNVYSSLHDTGNYLAELKLTVSTFTTSNEEPVRPYEAWIYQDTVLPSKFEEDKVITISIPEDARSNVYVSIVFDVSSSALDLSEPAQTNLAVHGPMVVSKTYSDLYSEINEANTNTSLLQADFDLYVDTHSYTNSEYNALSSESALQTEYDSLKSTYDQYVESHSHSNTEYDILESQLSNDDPQTAVESADNFQQYLIYVLIGTTLLFVITTIYFARKKQKN